ncbi:hypothetical protein P171DRAFT_468766 [Karstenula rhodostoma CBS 690.94]|uniref:ABM domain-containing protein n=1 Tax=Karstenula rhodostoma CBS 690.94 TaxID=1392251 RepID=A0A9P4UHB1_9PLEO|nr:hypothetical protein P171DRAFT_468766 [Karstenula rhodostoma CBS 690.94]
MSLHVTFHVDPSNVAAILKALKPAYDAVIAEPECVFYEVYQSADTPGRIKFVENWNASVEWFLEVQVKKEYYKEYIETTTPMWVKPRQHELYERAAGNEWVTVKDAMLK